MKNSFEGLESLRSQEKVPEVISEVKELLEENYFDEVTLEEHEGGGYVLTNPRSDFELWVDADGVEFVINNLEISRNNKGVGTGLIENLKEICANDQYERIIANKVKNESWEFWVDKCGFERDTENFGNAVFLLN